MKQLGTLDSAFINLENSNTPQHIGGLGIYDVSTAPGGFVRFKDVIVNFEQRFTRVPLFRTRLVRVPGQIDQPYWVEDKDFDLEFHLRHIALPAPGDWRQLWIQVARLHARSLDMSRPLWEAYIIEGLDNIPDVPKGAFAMYTKIHHSLVDGAGGQSFMTALHDLEPDPGPEANESNSTMVIDRQPSNAELLTKALVNRTKNTVTLTKGIATTAVRLAKYGISVARDEVPSLDMNAPKTRFNKAVGPHRVADAAVFQLRDFKEIKNTAGATMNDVALSVIGGALRKFLQHYNELPDDSLAAGIPLNMRTRRAHTDENNQVGSMFTSLHTNIEDPAERLLAVHESANKAKISNENNPLVETMRVAGVFSPALSQMVASFWAKNELSRFVPMNISTVISNVPGPNFPIYCAGAQMVRYHGLGLLTPGCGVFHLVFSSNGIVTITVLADREIIADPEFYRHCVEESFNETKAAVLGSAPQKIAAAKTSPQTSAVNKAPAKKSTAKKATAKKATAKKSPAKKPPIKKPAAKKASAKSTPAKKAKAKKAPAKTRAKKVPAKAKAATTRKAGVAVGRVA